MPDSALEHEARGFAESIGRLLTGALEVGADPIGVVLVGERLSITTTDPKGLLLRAEGREVVRLKIRYECTWDSAERFLAIEESEFQVFDASGSAPIVRYEYVRHPTGSVPAAHIQVHGESAALAHSAALGGRSTRRARALDRNRPARLSAVHLPVGGRRFRPALEDVVELLIDELGLDVVDGWQTVLRAGRREWRAKQALSVVRDDPESAAELLRSLGYDVRRPIDGAASRNPKPFEEL